MRLPRLVFPVSAVALAASIAALQDGCSGPTAYLTLDTPAPPIAVVASAGLSSITVSWSIDTSSRPAPDSFRLYGAIGGWTDWSASLPGAFLSSGLTCCVHTQTGLQNETTYVVAMSSDWEGPESPLSAFVSARPPGWRGTRQIGTAQYDNAQGVGIGPDGGVIIAGSTYGVLPSQTSAGETDLFVVRLDPSGKSMWAKQFGGLQDEYVADLSVDDSGNAYVVGETFGSLDGKTNLGFYDVFVVKYDMLGERQWTRLVSTTADDRALGGASNISSVVVAGVHVTTSVPFESSGFVQKLDSSGILVWSNVVQSPARDAARDCAIDVEGNVFVVGDTDGDLFAEANSFPGRSELFVAKYSSGGLLVWGHLFGSTDDDYAEGIALAGGDLVVVGHTGGALYGQANAGSGDLFVMRIDGSGTREWTRVFGTSSFERAFDVAIDAGGNVLVSAEVSVSFGGTAAGGVDVLLAKLSPAGEVQWMRQLGSPSGDLGRRVAVDERGNTFVAVESPGDFDSIASRGGVDGYVVKYSAAGNKE